MATPQTYQAMARQAAMEYDIDPNLFMGLVRQESGWNPRATSSAGAYGLTQLMPGTMRDPGFGVRGISDAERDNPMSQLRLGARYLRAMLDRYEGNVDKALAAYNWGAGNVDTKGLGKAPRETRDYLKRVKGYADEYGGEGYTLPGADAQAEAMPSGETLSFGAQGGNRDGDYTAGTSFGAQAGLGGGYDRATGTTGNPNQDRGMLGNLMSGAIRGGLAGGLPGAALGALTAAVAGSFNRDEEQTATGTAQAAQPDDGFGLDDAVRSGITGFRAGGPLGALGSIATGWAADTFGDRVRGALGFDPANQPIDRAPAGQAGLGVNTGMYDTGLGFSGGVNEYGVAGNDALSNALTNALSGGRSGGSGVVGNDSLSESMRDAGL